MQNQGNFQGNYPNMPNQNMRGNPYQPNQMQNPVDMLRNQMQSRVQEQFGQFMPQSQQTAQPQYQYLPCVIVDSIDQFRAMPAAPDGSVTLFSNLANGRIYMNRLDKDTNELFMGEFILSDKPIKPISNFVPQSEFDEMKGQIGQINSMLQQIIGGMNNANEQLGSANTAAEPIPTATTGPKAKSVRPAGPAATNESAGDSQTS